jgi:peptidase E
MARLIKVPGALVQTYRDLKESTVEEFIRKNVVLLGEGHTRSILKKLIRWGLVEIEKN